MDQKQIIQQICKRLNISQEQYFDMLLDTGREFFTWLNHGYDLLDAFLQSKELWNWWKIQYYILDEELLGKPYTITVKFYRYMHLGIKVFPQQSIILKAIEDYEKNTLKTVDKSIINTI